MKIACATMVFNESFWLPIWLEYYKKITPHLFIIDNGSNDNSFLNVNANDFTKIDLPNKHLFNNEFLRSTVNNFVKDKLRNFDIVMVPEVDEFVFYRHGTIEDLVKSKPQEYYYANGFDLIHTPLETDLDLSKPIIRQRQYWKKAPGFSKPCIQTKFHPYSVGLHRLEEHSNLELAALANFYVEGLYLLHAHYIDRNIQIARHNGRIAGKPAHPENKGANVKTTDQMLEYMDKKCSPPFTKIPDFIYEFIDITIPKA